uniref:Pre-mRNA-splicing factor SPF27 n=1 Tax=Panagrolaimus sp. JU765 TaxID=591449 RepID=A0AC34R031_9BILA
MAETNTAIDAIDESRFGVPDLEQVDPKDPQGTLKTLELFEAQLMFMDLRKHHLQLAQKYASGSLRQTSSALKYASDEIGRKATELKKETFEIHRERKREQTQLGKQIKDLEETWNEETERVNNLIKAIATKKSEIQKNIEDIEN